MSDIGRVNSKEETPLIGSKVCWRIKSFSNVSVGKEKSLTTL